MSSKALDSREKAEKIEHKVFEQLDAILFIPREINLQIEVQDLLAVLEGDVEVLADGEELELVHVVPIASIDRGSTLVVGYA